MRSQRLCLQLGILMACIMLVQPVTAGQVVKKTERDWARQALANEAALDTAGIPDNSISVLYFTNIGTDPALDVLQKGLTFMLITDLAKIDRLRVVERVKLQALLDEMRLGASDIVDTASASRMGRFLGARFLVGGEISGGSDGGGPVNEAALRRALSAGIRVEPVLVDVPDHEKQSLPAVDGWLDQLFKLEKTLLFAIVDQLDIKLSESEKAILREPLALDERAAFYFFMGLNASDHEMYDAAGGYYEKALTRDERMQPAIDALAELRQLGLYAAMKRPMSPLWSIRNRTSLTSSVIPADAVRRMRTPADVERHESLTAVVPKSGSTRFPSFATGM